jgi:hypothetical protein
MTLVASVSLLLSACGGGAALPPSATIINIRMTEYHFAVRFSAPTGRAVFRVFNAGRLNHNLTLEKLPSDFPPINVQLHSSTRRGAPAVAIMPTLRPGQSNIFAADLTPGRYAILSSVKGRDGVVDALEGMNAEIRVRRR